MGQRTRRFRAERVVIDEHGVVTPSHRVETVAVEEPFEVRVGGETLTVTMRTPGDDLELAHGLMLAEGLIRERADVLTARYCADTDTMNLLDVALRDPSARVPATAQRSLAAHGGCGLCGKDSIDAVRAALGATPPVDADRPVVAARTLIALPDALRERQQIFSRTGGAHAAALCTADGEPLVVREDIGRHNAVDKVIGWSVLSERSRGDLVLVVTSRASFEIVQKAAAARIGVLACVSAPSSLAIEAADELGITLVAFARRPRMTVFTHPDRIETEHDRRKDDLSVHAGPGALP